ncbi:MAG: glycosyltransferase family 2 protein [Xanthomonadaceae bacterium]|uniref:Glycosyltransferase family 2 protein n=1 Tax=Thermomonas beijingensis TaxID=2872701 RepID=A0ABS7TAS1_9GAMM|nr:glycosyltransferase family 2 protein [Thermomonas beijingensis]MBZ4184938.1 glycosyltransferase family 2 protein [Thermomonas beijingensis]MDE2380576.1 glycosyltransferase family 2 protein [Xanthomonadaceae bacterium]
MTKLISIVTPLFNEEENVDDLCSRIAAVMASLPYDYEHLCIDNCSKDRTVALLRARAARDPKLKVIVNARNFGHIRSPYHALLQAAGDAVVVIAGDLQDPPEMIPEFIKKWEDGFKTVMAVKPESEESSLIFFVRKIYYKIINRISEVPLIDNATGAGLFDRDVIEILRSIADPYPYTRGLVCEIGYPIATVPFKQPRRTRGVTSQNFYTLYDIAMLGITKHSKLPLRLMAMLGFALAIVSLLAAFGYLLAKLLFWDKFQFGTAPILIGMFLFGAIQMLFLGMLGEYIASIQTQVRKLPLVVESERINF